MQPVAVNTVSPDREGRLVLVNGKLIGVLVHLAAPEHKHQVGTWFVEVALGRVQGLRPRPFDTSDEAIR